MDDVECVTKQIKLSCSRLFCTVWKAQIRLSVKLLSSCWKKTCKVTFTQPEEMKPNRNKQQHLGRWSAGERQ